MANLCHISHRKKSKIFIYTSLQIGTDSNKIYSLTETQQCSYYVPYIQGDSEDNVSSLEGDSVGHCEKKFHINMCLILNDYGQRTLESGEKVLPSLHLL